MSTAIESPKRLPPALDKPLALQKALLGGDERKGSKGKSNPEDAEKHKSTSGNVGTIVDTLA
jgi:hypothetical protein